MHGKSLNTPQHEFTQDANSPLANQTFSHKLPTTRELHCLTARAAVVLMQWRHVSMKNLFDATVANQVKTRVGQLEPQSERRWGKMTAAQMLAHCSVSMQWAVGEVVPEKGPLPIRLMGRLVKPMVFRNEDPIRKNSPTATSLRMEGEKDFGKERQRLLELIDRFAAGGAARCTKNPHSFFGKMTPEEWSILMYKHLDHHLRQFGV
jgi:hypothetical protein